MRVIRQDIHADTIRFVVPAAMYRMNEAGLTRLDAVHRIAAELGFEVVDPKTMQAIPIGADAENYQIMIRG